jgi:hypothetical protein
LRFLLWPAQSTRAGRFFQHVFSFVRVNATAAVDAIDGLSGQR